MGSVRVSFVARRVGHSLGSSFDGETLPYGQRVCCSLGLYDKKHERLIKHAVVRICSII